MLQNYIILKLFPLYITEIIPNTRIWWMFTIQKGA